MNAYAPISTPHRMVAFAPMVAPSDTSVDDFIVTPSVIVTNTNNSGATFGVALGQQSDSTLTITQTVNGTFNGIICDGPNDNATGTSCVTGGGLLLNLVVTGTATLDLTNTNIYSGSTTVNGGTLKVDGSIQTIGQGVGLLTATRPPFRSLGATFALKRENPHQAG